LELLEGERGIPVEVSLSRNMDWRPVYSHVAEHGMRNSNTMAVAPTATISNISGCFPCIEPIYKNIYVKANISGEFTIVNHYLIADLKRLGLWNDEMLEQLKYYDGKLALIAAVPDELKAKYKEAFEVSALRMLQLTAARGKWIDQSQSHNVFMEGVSGKLLSEIYVSAWKMGLKTTYYLRTLAATQIEKSTLDASKFGYTQNREYQRPVAAQSGSGMGGNGMGGNGMGGNGIGGNGTPLAAASVEAAPSQGVVEAAQHPEPQLCRIEDPDCEACQ
jgi:ribonucleoside-diphosphate reductase alpha chain